MGIPTILIKNSKIPLIALSLLSALSFPLAALAQDSFYINELQVNTTGADWEFVELLGKPGAPLGHLTLLVIESDAGTSAGTIDRVISLAGEAIDANGYFTAGSPAAETAYSTTFDLDIADNSFENSTATYLLVADFSGALSDDLDSDDDGILDATPWTSIVDSVNLRDDDLGDLSYSPDSVGPDGSNLPAGTYRCDGSFGSNLLSFGTADGTPGALNSQCAAPTVYLNEITVSTTGTDFEFFEVQGNPGTDLGGSTLLVVESDNGLSAGNIDRVVPLAGPVPRDGFWVAMSAEAQTVYGFAGDMAIANDTFENSTTSNLLVFEFSGAVNGDVDTDNLGTINATFWSSISDGVSFRDSGATDFNYSGGPTVGPDGTFLPAGGFRCPDAPAGVFSIANIHNFNLPDGTPGVSNTCGQNHAPPQVVQTDPVNGSSGVATDADITLVFSKPVDINGDFAEVDCPSYGGTPEFFSGPYVAVNTVTIDPTDFGSDDYCVVTIFDDAINDYPVAQPGADNPTTIASHILDGDGDGIEGGDFVFSFLVNVEIPFGVCGDDATLISAIQGSGSASPLAGQGHVIEGVVVGDYQETSTTNPSRPELQGFFVQEEDADNDADPATSEGIFVYDPDKTLEVAEGDLVRVGGTVSEAFGNTQIESVSEMLNCDTGLSVTPASIDLPIPPAFASIDDFWEQYEGMLLTFADVMTVTEQFELARFGQMVLSEGGLLRQYSQDAPLPLTEADYLAWLDNQARRSIKLDDYNSQQNIDPVFHPQPGGFAVDNYIRMGATTNLVGVLEVRFNEWNLQPQKTAPVSFANPARPAAPPVLSGNVHVAALNVLNYFNGDGLGGGFPTARGADSQAELDRQTDKIVAAIIAMDADVLGLMEIENDGDGANDALAYLVDAVNAVAGAGTYAIVPAGANGGTDEIKVALMYKPAAVELVGAAAVLADPAFTDPNGYGTQMSRPALAQTFRVVDVANPDIGSAFTAVVLHLKSKGSGCGVGDDSVEQGSCNDTRTKGVIALLDWLATDPTDTLTNIGVMDPDVFIMGDLNAYFQEDPMQVLYNAGYTNLIAQADASYVFDGNQGSLDHLLASSSLSAQILTGGIWDINAEENSLLDYNDTVLDAGEAAFEAKPPTNPLYADGPFRSSDHDPVLSGADLADAPVVDATDPADTATEVDVGSNIAISFDVAVNATSDSFTIVCNETGMHSFVLSGGPTDFVLNPDTDFGLSETCTVTVLANEVSEPVGSTPMLDDYVFSFVTSNQSRAVISVVKDFNDGNPGEVNVLLDCNTGLILDQDKTISEGAGVEFVITSFEPAELYCTVTEEPVPGYETLYDNGLGLSESGCVFEAITTTTEQDCVVHNHLVQVNVTVTKEWITSGLGDELPTDARAGFQCFNQAIIDPEACSADSVTGVIPPVSSGTLYFSGTLDSESIGVWPNWNDSTYCVIDEQVTDDSVEADDSDCQNVAVLVGQQGAGCTIVNTRFFEGIPTLSRFNLVLLSMLMLITSLVAVRRFNS